MEIVGSRTNGVWSTQIEVEYSRKFKPEVLPEKWPAALERMSEGNGGMANRHVLHHNLNFAGSFCRRR